MELKQSHKEDQAFNPAVSCLVSTITGKHCCLLSNPSSLSLNELEGREERTMIKAGREKERVAEKAPPPPPLPHLSLRC